MAWSKNLNSKNLKILFNILIFIVLNTTFTINT